MNNWRLGKNVKGSDMSAYIHIYTHILVYKVKKR
jgi:hypothetical protein